MRSARVLGVLLALCAVFPADAREFRSSDIYPFDYPTVQAVVAGRQADARAQRRQARHHRAGLRRSRFGEPHRRPGSQRPARHGAHQSRGFEQPRTVDGGARSSLSLQVEGTHAAQSSTGRSARKSSPASKAHGLIGLCFYDGGPRHFYSSKRAIRTPADLKGLKVRVQQADIWAGMFRALGAEPVVVPADRVYLKPAVRRDRRSGAQLAVLCVVAPLSGRALFQPDRAFDGAGRPGLLQACMGHAVGR